MASLSNVPELPRPTLFISYASEDREAARRLRDAMGETGIDVWYDEDELTGGDAWDQKIRRRIRECDYFMPLVSEATQRRREGYFRREWRQAAERTLDMADDVMFLLPVNISDVPEATARVPEKFQQVQWTSCPNGEPNPEFEDLCQRVLRGDDAIQASPHRAGRSHSSPPHAPQPKRKGRNLPPYPPQPHRRPNEAAWLHVFNLMVWIVRCGYRAYTGFPRLLRWVVIFWVFLILVRGCDGPEITVDPPEGNTPDMGEIIRQANEAVIQAGAEGSAEATEGTGEVSGFGKLLGALADAVQAGQTLALVPFSHDGSPGSEAIAEQVFQGILGPVSAGNESELSFSPVPLGMDPSGADLANRLGRTEATYLLTGWVTAEEVTVVVQTTGQLEPLWRETYQRSEATPESIAADASGHIITLGIFGQNEAAPVESGPTPEAEAAPEAEPDSPPAN